MSETKSPSPNGSENIITLQGMYEDYFLDYASYVILERAVPGVNDGLKPVQRRILHAMKEMDDGRYHKVANIIGQTMQYHPHGDAAIGDALVQLGQKDLLIDTQGNWGNILTGDRSAAARYIEARLTKFALEVAFNPQTTDWQVTYDGRKNEPIALPMKFPLLLAQGGEGIAVGLSTKLLPHNFKELIQASIKILEDKKVKIYPDFPTAGMIDVSDYQNGRRGGRVKVRARIEKVDKNTLIVRELPYGITTGVLIDSIIKANDKGKIKIKKVTDNTAQEVEVQIDLAPGVSPDVAIDALYAFTHCEISIAPNACVIIEDKPHFTTVEEILRLSTFQTKELLRQELLIKQAELRQKWHMASLEKVFIEKRIYRKIEQSESYEEALATIDQELRIYVAVPSDPPQAGDGRLRLMREITEDDLIKLTEIRIKRISKYNAFKADELLARLKDELAQVQHDLEHLTEYTIAYFQRLLEKYGVGRDRLTEITSFENIQITEVVANNAKLYVNRNEGFIGHSLKGAEEVCDCSDIDDIITFRKDGTFQVNRISDKIFVGNDIIHVDVWKRNDERTTYNMAYVDAKSGKTYVKRFNVTSVTRERDYDLTKGNKGSRCLYFSANPNGEAEIVTIRLTQGCAAKKKIFDFDFGDLAIKGRSAQGNILTKYPIRKIELKEVGKSTLGAIKVWMDEVSGRLNTDERGQYLGAFDTGDLILVIYRNGNYEMCELDQNRRFPADQIAHIGKFDPEAVINVVYYEGEKGITLAKRFQIETSSLNQTFQFLTDHRSTKLLFIKVGAAPKIEYKYRVKGQAKEESVDLEEFIDVKGWKAMGNKLSEYKLIKVTEVQKASGFEKEKDGYQAGDTLEFDL